MRFIILLLAFGFITNGAFSRPSQAAENESEVYADYEEKESAADEYINEKQDKDSQDIEARSEIQDEGIRTQALKNNEYENLMEGKLDINKNENMDRAEEEMPLPGRHKSNSRHDETEEDEDFLQPVPNARFNTLKRNQNNNEYRSGETDVSSSDGSMGNDRRMIKEKNDYNNEAIERRDLPLYKQITYYNKVQGDLFHKKKPNGIFNSNRDRRETAHNQQENLNDDKNIEKKEENNNEDSVSAIKRNIKKLSREELEDLLNSLSDDKRALLNKIINNKITNDNVNKREITKKAGAVEENNYLENSRSDLNKLESGSSVSALSQSETTETTKQSESSEISKTKSPESDENTSPNNESKDELNDINVNINQESMQNGVAQSKDSDGKEKLKNENKRETNIEEISPDKPEMINESSNNENYDSDNDANWSELMKDESELHKTYSNLYKRGIDDYSNTADIKSLEDSFPYYEAENTKSSDSQMAPLIRVKRTNNIKRSLDLSSGNMKVPYLPVAVNDDDIDKDEFDDGSNFENSYNNEKVGKEENKNFGYYDMRSNKNCQITKPSHKSEKDSAKIGSDTDNILSNIEGVDDNLMYNNNEIRKKRVADDADANKLHQESIDPVASFEGNNMRDSLSKNDLNYQDQDAFGAIQRGSNEELGRYKRIRRLKQSPSQENPH